MILGRIRLDDLLSQDQAAWVAAQSVTELMPQELTIPGSCDESCRLTEARLQADERAGERRTCQVSGIPPAFQPERRSRVERRQVDGRHFVSRAAADMAKTHRFNSTPRTQVRTFLFSVLLATLLLAWLTPAAN